MRKPSYEELEKLYNVMEERLTKLSILLSNDNSFMANAAKLHVISMRYLMNQVGTWPPNTPFSLKFNTIEFDGWFNNGREQFRRYVHLNDVSDALIRLTPKSRLIIGVFE